MVECFFTYPPKDRNPLEGLLEYNVYVPMRVHEVRKAPRIPVDKIVASEQSKAPDKEARPHHQSAYIYVFHSH